MKKILAAKLHLKNILPVGIVLFALVVSGALAYIFTPKPQQEAAVSHQDSKKVAMVIKEKIATPSVTPAGERVLGAAVYQKVTSAPVAPAAATTQNTSTSNNQTTTTTSSSQPASTTTSSSNSTQQTIPQTNTSAPTSTPTPVPTAQPISSTVSMQVQDPGGNSSFTVTLNNGANACDVLQEAKNEGKINSVTFNDDYMSTMHSRYITEINGYSNNWTFTVNGSSPQGCSLINPKPNDTIVWKFS